MRRHLWTLTLALLAAGSPGARADLITYRFSGIVSGTLGGGQLVDAPFEFALTTDTEGVSQPTSDSFRTQEAALEFSIGGLGGTFTAPFSVFRSGSSVGLATAGGGELLRLAGASLAGYDLKTSFGPLTQAPPAFLEVGVPFDTTLGVLTFSEDADTTATFRAEVSPVPEPSSLMAAYLGVAAALGYAGPRARRGRGPSRAE